MSGHSKWSTIKHRKGAQDAKRGKIFTKLIKEISVAVRAGGSDADANPRLRTALLAARNANMPNDNVQRAIKKASGDMDGVDYFELTYEGYGPGGAAIMVNALTDNKNRTAAEVRSIFSKHGGNLGELGCVSYLFQRQGVLAYSAEKYTENQIIEVALEHKAQDVISIGDEIEVICEPTDFEQLLHAMEENEFESLSSGVIWRPQAQLELSDDDLRKVVKLIEILDDHDDVQEVSSNINIPENFEIE